MYLRKKFNIDSEIDTIFLIAIYCTRETSLNSVMRQPEQ